MIFTNTNETEDGTSKGIKLKLHYFIVEETKQVAENEYKVYSRMDLEITNVDKTTHRKKLKKVFTVYDDGKVRKIKNIEQM